MYGYEDDAKLLIRQYGLNVLNNTNPSLYGLLRGVSGTNYNMSAFSPDRLAARLVKLIGSDSNCEINPLILFGAYKMHEAGFDSGGMPFNMYWRIPIDMTKYSTTRLWSGTIGSAVRDHRTKGLIDCCSAEIYTGYGMQNIDDQSPNMPLISAYDMLRILANDINRPSEYARAHLDLCNEIANAIDEQHKIKEQSTTTELNALKLENEQLKKRLKAMEKAIGIVSYDYENLKTRIEPFKSELAIVQRTMIRIIRSHYGAPVAVLVAPKV